MARSPIAGISGVLGELIGDPPDSAAVVPNHEAPTAEQHPCPRASHSTASSDHARRRARLGRPSGRDTGSQSPKEKVTLRIDAELIACYRDWSWESRIQLGELVEKALRTYRQACQAKNTGRS